ncbi:MAG: hypothetical protein IPN94_23315 [Sphingobacteriales bacterium]|nr:hypothetical protein [Sphingobacteriales bacterium]
MNIPETQKGKIVLLMAEFDTGIVLNFDGSRYKKTDEYHYKIMDSMEDAEKFAKAKINEETACVEFIFYDHNGNYICTISPI